MKWRSDEKVEKKKNKSSCPCPMSKGAFVPHQCITFIFFFFFFFLFLLVILFQYSQRTDCSVSRCTQCNLPCHAAHKRTHTRTHAHTDTHTNARTPHTPQPLLCGCLSAQPTLPALARPRGLSNCLPTSLTLMILSLSHTHTVHYVCDYS